MFRDDEGEGRPPFGRGGPQRDFYGGNGGSGRYPSRREGPDSYGSGGGYGGSRGGGGYRSGPRKNEMGFHGDTRPNPRIEEELFFTNESQTTGINFDKVLYFAMVCDKLRIE